MTDSVKEQLSAGLDGELPPAELELLLKRLAREESLGRTASRYSAIGAALRDQGPLASVDFAARVARAVAQEQAPKSSAGAPVPRLDTRRWLRPAISAALAAGIAVFAVLIVNRPQPGAPEPVATTQPPPDSFAAPATAGTVVRWPAERLTNYVVAHSEYSSPLGRPMVLNSLLIEQMPPDEPPAAPELAPPAP